MGFLPKLCMYVDRSFPFKAKTGSLPPLSLSLYTPIEIAPEGPRGKLWRGYTHIQPLCPCESPMNRDTRKGNQALATSPLKQWGKRLGRESGKKSTRGVLLAMQEMMRWVSLILIVPLDEDQDSK